MRRFIFNHRIWPNFEEITLIGHTDKTVELIELELEKPYAIDGIILTPFKTDHTEGSCGYIIEKNSSAILFTADTYKCSRIWELIDEHPNIHTLINEVFYPSSFAKLAYDSKHLTPALLKEELIQPKRRNFTLYVMHLKALFQETIIKELNTLHLLHNEGKVLVDGDRINYTQL